MALCPVRKNTHKRASALSTKIHTLDEKRYNKKNDKSTLTLERSSYLSLNYLVYSDDTTAAGCPAFFVSTGKKK